MLSCIISTPLSRPGLTLQAARNLYPLQFQ